MQVFYKINKKNLACPQSRPCQARFEFAYSGEPLIDSRQPKQSSGNYVAIYGEFAVADEGDLYRLTIGQYDP